jgi:hypothetical protein
LFMHLPSKSFFCILGREQFVDKEKEDEINIDSRNLNSNGFFICDLIILF